MMRYVFSQSLGCGTGQIMMPRTWHRHWSLDALLRLEVPTGVTILHESARNSRHKADNDFLAL